MTRHDLPLVAFTLLVQLALGAVALAAMLPLRLAGLVGPHPVIPHVLYMPHLLYLAAALLVAAMAASLLHLGAPLGALRSLGNLRTSWLSREVLFTGLFTGLVAAAAAMEAFDLPTTNLLWLASVTGLAAIFTMARLYQATVRPGWATLFTPVSFYAATLTLGTALGAPLVLLAVRSGNLSVAAAQLLLRDIVLTGTAALAALLIALPLYLVGLSRGTTSARASLQLLGSRFQLSLGLRLAAAAGGIALLTWGGLALQLGPVLAGALLLVTAEVLGRVLFFATGVSTGVGQL